MLEAEFTQLALSKLKQLAEERKIVVSGDKRKKQTYVDALVEDARARALASVHDDMKLADLKKMAADQKLRIEGDKRYKQTYIDALRMSQETSQVNVAVSSDTQTKKQTYAEALPEDDMKQPRATPATADLAGAQSSSEITMAEPRELPAKAVKKSSSHIGQASTRFSDMKLAVLKQMVADRKLRVDGDKRYKQTFIDALIMSEEMSVSSSKLNHRHKLRPVSITIKQEQKAESLQKMPAPTTSTTRKKRIKQREQEQFSSSSSPKHLISEYIQDTLNPEAFHKDGRLYIMAPAVNSSGDFYHYLVLMLLCPDVHVVHAFDAGTTKDQHIRALALLTSLGLDDRYECVDLAAETRAPRPNEREFALRKHFASKGLVGMNGKAVTKLLARIFHHFGFEHVSTLVRNEVATQLERAGNADSKTRGALKKTVGLIPKGKQLVLINHRSSSGANDQHLFQANQVNDLCKRIVKDGCHPVILLAGVKESAFTVNKVSGVTPTVIDAFQANGKAFHLLLLLSLHQMNEDLPSLMVGCTSGTLDIAAFLGFSCLNVHRFDRLYGTHKPHLTAQDYRLLLQSKFMDIVGAGTKELETAVEHWLPLGTLRETSLQLECTPEPKPRGRTHNSRHCLECIEGMCRPDGCKIANCSKISLWKNSDESMHLSKFCSAD